MRYLRTVSTQRLLALIAGLVILIVGGTAIAVAAAGNGPVPPRASLAAAIHRALSARGVTGISARISFTNTLIGSNEIPDGPTDPLLQGATGRLWLGDNRLRLELQSDNGDAQIVLANGRFWIYDPSSNTVYRGTVPAHLLGDTSAKAQAASAHAQAIPSVSEITRALSHLSKHTVLSGAIPSDVAGQAAYTVRIQPPRHAGGLLGNLQLAWDAYRGVPLRFAVYARGSGSPVLELKATDISYGRVSPGAFQISPPPGAKVVRISIPSGSPTKASTHSKRARHGSDVTSVAAIARHLSFSLDAPTTLGHLNRAHVSLVRMGGTAGALSVYGHGLGSVIVLEGAAPAAGANGSGRINGGGSGSLNLPTVTINGTAATELDTALGTLIRFTRNGVSYTVIGSVSPAVARAVARGL
jgi:outer membrane lipoprotein-sorting protein